MVLIISDNFEASTNDVIDWLIFYKVPYTRINETTKVTLSDIYIDNDKSEVGIILNDDFHTDIYIDLSSIKSVWYRRGEINMFTPSSNSITSIDSAEQKKLNSHLFLAKEDLVYYIHMFLKEKVHINTFYDNDLNKNFTLHLAKKCGLKIPDTLITTVKSKVHKIKKREIITKAIRFCVVLFKKRVLSAGTVLVEDEVMNKVPAHFFPSLFQEKLEKKYEIRSFFMHGKFYSTAIFSQLDQKTSIDFRNYNFEKPNRVIPFTLPNSITSKLVYLMKTIDINCGSIDLVVTEENDFVFLEVNPIGQFAQVSTPGNFYLERLIAKTLTV